MLEHPKGIWTSAVLEAFRHHFHEHPFSRYYQSGGDGSPRQITDVVSSSAWRRTAVYNESFRPAGFETEMVVWLPASAVGQVTVAVHRRRGHFTERDRLILDLLRPHFARAHRNATLLTRIRTAVDTLTQGFAIVDERSRPAFVNQAARACLDRYFGPRKWGARFLPDVVQRWPRHQRTNLARRTDVPAVIAPLRVEGKGRCLLIHWCPDGSDVLFFEELPADPIDGADLEALGLTSREAEILRWVARGKTNAEIGTILSISVRTVAKHL
jgi:PAS domain-containing protein